MNRQLFNAMVAQYGKQTVTSEDNVLEWNGGEHCYLPSLKFYGACSQYPTPTPDNPVDIYDHIGVYKVNSENDYIGLPNLRGIGDYKDEWDYVTGKGIRRIDTLTLDGVTEGRKIIAVYKNSTSGYYFGLMYTKYKNIKIGADCTMLSTHFKAETAIRLGNIYISGSGANEAKMLYMFHTDQTLDTVDKWNAWLAEQYANGTPVTVYYAMAEPIPFEERVQPYKPIPNDSGRISFVDGNVSDVPFEATYITHS